MRTMTPDTALALAAFALVTSISPGPNNIMLMASGANHGIARTLPHAAGVAIGFPAMIVLVGVGLAEVVLARPAARTVLEAASLAYLLYLAFRIATAAPPEPGRAGGRPLTFAEAALFQWVNPKAWAMALGTFGAYATDPTPATAVLAAATFGAVAVPCILLWTALGRGMARLVLAGRRLRLFNLAMAGLLVLSLAPVLAD